MAIKLVPLTSERTNISLLVYGLPATGKTSLVTNLPESMRPAVILDADFGLEAVTGVIDLDGIQRIILEDYKDMNRALKAITLPDTNSQKPEWAVGVKTVIIDSLSSLHSATTLQLAASADTKSPSPFQPSQQDYLIAQGAMTGFIKNLQQQGINVLATSGVDTREGQMGPDIAPGLKRNLLHAFGYILESSFAPAPDGSMVYVLRTMPRSETDIVKIRNPHLLHHIKAASVDMIKAAGWKPTPGNAGMLMVAEPGTAPNKNQIDFRIFHEWYMKALTGEIK